MAPWITRTESRSSARTARRGWWSTRPPAGGKGLDELLEGLDREKEQAEDLFQKEVDAHKDRDRLLAEKFEEAMKRAEDADDGTPPPRPFDFD